MFDADEFVQESIESLQKTIDDVAIIACSGGVDSTVAAVIANQAVGELLGLLQFGVEYKADAGLAPIQLHFGARGS